MVMLAGSLVLLLLYALSLVFRVHPLVEVADEADKLHLKLIAESIYEYHGKHGRWPTKADDLRETSLPLTAPHDIETVKNGPYVVVWPKKLDPDPKKNGQRLLVYTRGGPARMGWIWLCWGDFRMEYVSGEQFDAILRAAEE
jgi:hypothetical protein